MKKLLFVILVICSAALIGCSSSANVDTGKPEDTAENNDGILISGTPSEVVEQAQEYSDNEKLNVETTGYVSAIVQDDESGEWCVIITDEFLNYPDYLSGISVNSFFEQEPGVSLGDYVILTGTTYANATSSSIMTLINSTLELTDIQSEELSDVLPDAKEVSHDFNSATNQDETFYEIQYQIPASWERKPSSSNEDIIYYYPENGMLMVEYENYTLTYNESGFESLINSIANGSSTENFVELNHYATTVIDYPALSLTYTATVSDVPLTAYAIIFSNESSTYMFIYCDYDKSDYDRSQDFEEIINSISYIESPTTITEELKKTLPSVNSDMLETGEYNGQTVLIENCVVDAVTKYECTLWIPAEDSYKSYEEIYYSTSDVPEEILAELQDGDTVTVLLSIFDDGSYGGSSILDLEITGTADLNTVYDSYKSSCSPLDYDAVVRDAKSYYHDIWYVSGTIEYIDNESSYGADYVIRTNAGLVYVHYDREASPRFIEGDYITVYGWTDSGLKSTYLSLAQVPSIWSKLIVLQ